MLRLLRTSRTILVFVSSPTVPANTAAKADKIPSFPPIPFAKKSAAMAPTRRPTDKRMLMADTTCAVRSAGKEYIEAWVVGMAAVSVKVPKVLPDEKSQIGRASCRERVCLAV